MDSSVLDALGNEDDIAGEIEESSEFQDKIYNCLAKITHSLRQLVIIDNPVEMHVIHPATGATTLNKTKLPTIEIKMFNGDFLQWRRFWEQFEITIHNDPDLSNINKFVYLQFLLEGKAAQAIDGLLLTRDNYDEAVQILTERFGNQQTLITAYMDEMVKIPKVTDMNDVTTLRTVYDKLDTNIRNLKDLSVETA